MKNQTFTKVNSFFIEIIIVILFFSVSSAVIAEVFAKAYIEKNLNKMTSSAIITAESISEVYSTNGNLNQTIEQVFSKDCASSSITANNYKIKLDKDLKWNGKSDDIILNVSEAKKPNPQGMLSYLDIEFISRDKVIYELSSSAYIPDKEES